MENINKLKKELDENVRDIMDNGYKKGVNDIKVTVNGSEFTLEYNADMHVGLIDVLNEQING